MKRRLRSILGRCGSFAVVSAVSLWIPVSLPSIAYGQLQGGTTYPINGVESPPTSFASMGTALSYLASSGILGPGNVILEFRSGYGGEVAPLTIPRISGTGASALVVFRPGAGYSAITAIAGTESEPWAIRIRGDYIALDGRQAGAGQGRNWTIRCTGPGGSGRGQSAVRLDNSNASITNVSVRHCLLEAEAANTTSAILAVTGSSSYTIRNVDLAYNLVQSTGASATRCRAHGIELAGATNLANTGVRVLGNEISRTSTNGIRLTGGFPGIRIEANVIHNPEPVMQTSADLYAGIYFSSSSSFGAEIACNLIYDLRHSNVVDGVNGIYIRNANTYGSTNSVCNNRIAVGRGIPQGAPVWGIHDASVPGALIDYDFNSVYISGGPVSGSAGSAAFRKDVGSSCGIRNNIFCNARSNAEGAQGTHWAISINGPGSIRAMGSNDYFVDGLGGVLGTDDNAATGNRQTLTAWMAAITTDLMSISENPEYQDPEGVIPNLRINAPIPSPLESAGVGVIGIGADFEGDLRHGIPGYGGQGTAPDIGADEFEGTSREVIPPTIQYLPLEDGTAASLRMLEGVTVSDASGVEGSPGARPRVYYRRERDANEWHDNAPDTGGWKYAEASGGTSPFDLLLDYSRLQGGAVSDGDVIHYFVVAQDRAPVPNVAIETGEFFNTPESVDLPGGAFPVIGQVHTYTIHAPLSGSITVGDGGDFPTLADAFDRINSGTVSADLTVVILSSGTAETRPATLDEIEYEGGPYTVTIKPEAGSSPMISGTTASALVRLHGADHVVIDGSNSPAGTSRDLTITNTSPDSGSAVVWGCSAGLANGVRHNTIKNCIIIGGTDARTLVGIGFGDSIVAVTGNGTDSEGTRIENNEVLGCRYGIYSAGVRGSLPEAGIQISGNTIGVSSPVDQLTCGILLRHQSGVRISDNDVVGIRRSDGPAIGISLGFVPASEFIGSAWGDTVRNADVSGNRIRAVECTGAAGYSAVGIAVAPTSDGITTLSNNMVTGINSPSTPGEIAAGIYAGCGEGSATRLWCNSVWMAGERGDAVDPSFGLAIARAGPGDPTIEVKGNVLMNTQTSSAPLPGNSYALGFAQEVNSGFDSNFNDLFVAGPQGVLAVTGGFVNTPGGDVATLSAWQNLGGFDLRSLSADPLFVSDDDLHISIAGPGVSPIADAGVILEGVGLDIDGDARTSSPDMGADEFTTYSLAVEVTGEGGVIRSPDFATYNPGSSVELDAVPDSGWAFESWSGDASGAENPLSLVMDSPKQLEARFEPLVLLSVEDVSIAEGDSSSRGALVVVNLSTASTDTVWVDWATSDSTAAAPGDYSSGSGEIVLLPGMTSDTLGVLVAGDHEDEADEVFSVRLTAPRNAVLADSVGAVTILDDDNPPLLSVGDDPPATGLARVLPNPSSGQVTIHYGIGNESQVRLRILDVSGRIVRSLVREAQAKGQRSVIWNGRDDHGYLVRSGVYILLFESDDWTDRVQLILSR